MHTDQEYNVGSLQQPIDRQLKEAIGGVRSMLLVVLVMAMVAHIEAAIAAAFVAHCCMLLLTAGVHQQSQQH